MSDASVPGPSGENAAMSADAARALAGGALGAAIASSLVAVFIIDHTLGLNTVDNLDVALGKRGGFVGQALHDASWFVLLPALAGLLGGLFGAFIAWTRPSYLLVLLLGAGIAALGVLSPWVLLLLSAGSESAPDSGYFVLVPIGIGLGVIMATPAFLAGVLGFRWLVGRVAGALPLVLAAGVVASIPPVRALFLVQGLRSRYAPLVLAARGDAEALDGTRRLARIANAQVGTQTPLQVAAKLGREDMVRALLDAGADPNPSSGGRSALHWAVERGDLGVARALMEAGADVAHEPRLLDAVPSGGRSGVFLLCLTGGTAATDWQDPSLVQAVEWVDADCIETMLAAGFPADARDKRGVTALMHAIHRKDLSEGQRIARLLLDSGADPNALDEEGRSALRLAAVRGDLSFVESLIAAGADPKAAQHRDQTALCGVFDLPWSTDENGRIVDALIAAGADVNEGVVQESTDLDESIRPRITALMAAALNDTVPLSVVSALIAAGAEVDAENHEGRTALMLVIGTGSTSGDGLTTTPRRVAVLDVLLKAGADVDHSTADGVTALMWAAQNRTPAPTVARLIAAGADVRACDSLGTSVLQRSISSTADIEVVKALLTAGADPNLVRDGGSSALARARHHQRADLVQVLIDAGARE